MARAFFLFTLLFLAFVFPAEAYDRVGANFTNSAPATYRYGDQLFRDAVADADAWWERVVGSRPDPLVFFVYDQDDEGTAYGQYDGGSIYLTRVTRNYWWSEANNRNEPRSVRRVALTHLWSIAAHERGHNLGLRHHSQAGCPGNIMCLAPTRPWRAFVWAKSKIPVRGPLNLP